MKINSDKLVESLIAVTCVLIILSAIGFDVYQVVKDWF